MNFSQGVVNTVGCGVAIGLTVKLTNYYCDQICEKIYPIHKESDDNGYYTPRLGLPVSKVEYEKLSLVTKTAAAIALVATGLLSGFGLGLGTGIVFGAATGYSSIVIPYSVTCAVVGVATASMHIPGVFTSLYNILS